MSVEEDTELRDLVSKTLENNGVLAKIRAELRASVFLALEEQENKAGPFENKALKEYLKSPQAALGLCIVREFLEYLELDFTLSVYNTETSHGKGYEYSGRNKLVKDLQIQNLNGKKGPLLSHILQLAQESGGISTDVKEGNTHTSTPNLKPLTGGNLFHNLSLGSEASVESPNVSLLPLDRTFTSEGPTVKVISNNDGAGNDKMVQSPVQLLSSESQIKLEEKQDTKSPEGANKEDINIYSTKVLANKDAVLKNSNKPNESGMGERKQNVEGKHSQNKPSKSDGKNSMASLNDLPPLDDLHERRNFNNAASINFASLGIHDDYEEDFLSTGSSATNENSKSHSLSHKSSNKQNPPKKEKSSEKKLTKDSAEKETSDKAATNSPVGSISEDLDDNTNSGIDDLLNSTASTENTVDATISHIRSNFADYIEEV
ncbi:FGFR1 oncogene partner-like [Thrips palmi]|uniref:FGFR1 oncogene partner-like n=1 Tax=Thrips palmi TaxID=161013 RepID=A0A6P8Z323_THRPL|nr:FGFR1 oncogene partner-like [Thrips palmi]